MLVLKAGTKIRPVTMETALFIEYIVIINHSDDKFYICKSFNTIQITYVHIYGELHSFCNVFKRNKCQFFAKYAN